ncbi:Bicoid-interacting protein 3 [Oesophagostomum dentatum]|uniref:RNA methyltransferase n=1 Tax=Oesophagostomum dentatum TaxID=61180 RepID=A0A0B1SJZ4_OESDE|nr:Bicoid-interacting protein 3 [Oesophagostomum dentatum]
MLYVRERWGTNYAAIEFKPEDFEMYLLETVGFESVEHLGAPCAKSKGFERPIDVYLKKPPKFMEREAKGDAET